METTDNVKHLQMIRMTLQEVRYIPILTISTHLTPYGVINYLYQCYDICLSVKNGCCKYLKVDGCLANEYANSLGSYTAKRLYPTNDGVERYIYFNYDNDNHLSYEDEDLDSNGDWIVI